MSGIRTLPPSARGLVVLVCAGGVLAVALSYAARPVSPDASMILFVMLAGLAGLIKVPLPVGGSLSLGYSFVLATLMAFGLGPSVLAGLLTTLGSGLVSRRGPSRPGLHQTAYNTASVAVSACIAGTGYLLAGGSVGILDLPGDLTGVVVYAALFSTVNIGLVTLVIHLADGRSLRAALSANFRWSIPGYVAGSSLAVLLNILLSEGNPLLLLLAAPFVYLVHLSYRARTEKAEEEKRHSEQTAAVYRGITESLALAIEAKDENTEEHLQRVEQYSIGLAEIIELPADEVEALRAAALLHDVGKVCVPDHILTKPGKLTPEEYEVMKQHPAVGADILAAVPFPYPLTPLVRHHHERWDGAGYPDGLAGDAIPLGARILTTVDCYDALISDRPYRKGVPQDQALAFLREQSGKMFDPEIVDLMIRHVDRLEARMRSNARPMHNPVRSAMTKSAPETSTELDTATRAAIASLGAAGGGAPEDRLRRLASDLEPLLGYRSLVLYRIDHQRNVLRASFAAGRAAGELLGHEIAVEELLSGWAMHHQRCAHGVVHRTAMGRDGSRFDLEALTDRVEVEQLGAQAVAPLNTGDRQLGILAVYRECTAPYGSREVEVLQAVAEWFADAAEGLDESEVRRSARA